jgi:hypothetical protein
MPISKPKRDLVIILAVGYGFPFIFFLATVGPGIFEIERDLGRGYHLYETNPSSIVIYRQILRDPPGIYDYDIVAAARVTQYAVISDASYIVGHVRRVNSGEFKDEQCPGWFIIETKEHASRCGMNESEYRRELIALEFDPETICYRSVR